MDLTPFDLLLELEGLEAKSDELMAQLRTLIVLAQEQSERTKAASTEDPS